MYDLVADIESYPEFLPWCGGAGIVSHDEKQVVASIKIAYHKIHKTFTTRNVLQPGASMEMQLVEGPFRHLHGLWRFESCGGPCAGTGVWQYRQYACRKLQAKGGGRLWRARVAGLS
jgi:ribosome-associated toxin RatA of RatAB toxin-antitoxin module